MNILNYGLNISQLLNNEQCICSKMLEKHGHLNDVMQIVSVSDPLNPLATLLCPKPLMALFDISYQCSIRGYFSDLFTFVPYFLNLN